jgi:hypothetical protein
LSMLRHFDGRARLRELLANVRDPTDPTDVRTLGEFVDFLAPEK